MGVGFLVIATLCYVAAAVDLWVGQRNRLMAGVFLAYAAANALLILVAYRGK